MLDVRTYVPGQLFLSRQSDRRTSVGSVTELFSSQSKIICNFQKAEIKELYLYCLI